MAQSIAVIGAGMAGLACARVLANAGHRVTVLDKGRGFGGRCATRRGDGVFFDHGAQYASAKSPLFKAYLAEAQQEGAVAAWPAIENLRADGHPRYVGTPGMSSIVQPFLKGIDARHSMRITGLRRLADGWHLESVNAVFDAVVVAIPAPQAIELFHDQLPLVEELRTVQYSPCWAGMVAFEVHLDAPDIIELTDGPIIWMARNTSKPGRDHVNDCWVLHTSPEWSKAELERPADEVASEFYATFTRALQMPLPPPMHLDAHRWRYARVTRALGRDFIWNSDERLGFCGDFCLGERVEDAFTSGHALGNAMAYHMEARG